jgi:hypothetical protein
VPLLIALKINILAIGLLILGITSIGGKIMHVRIKDSFKQTFPIIGPRE